MNNVLIISYSPLNRDPRVLRQIEVLKDNYSIETIGLVGSNVENVKHFGCHKNFFAKKIKKIELVLRNFFTTKRSVLYYLFCIDELLENEYKNPNVIIANDWDGLYAAVELKNYFNWNAKIYFDSHEYFPRYREGIYFNLSQKPLINYVFKQCRNEINIMTTVCPTLAKMYEDYFGFEEGFVRVITNAPSYEKELRPVFSGEKIKIIHHGGAMPERKIEAMIDMMAFLPNELYELSFMLVPTNRTYYDSLVKRSQKYSNVKFLEPVVFSDIPKLTNKYDIGLFILDNKHINYRYALPNKFFEYVQARLAVVVGDSPEMRNYIAQYNLGISTKTNEPEDLANAIKNISKEQIMEYKKNSDKYAELLSFESNKKELISIIQELIS